MCVQSFNVVTTYMAFAPEMATLFLALELVCFPVLTEYPFTSGLYFLIMSAMFNSGYDVM